MTVNRQAGPLAVALALAACGSRDAGKGAGERPGVASALDRTAVLAKIPADARAPAGIGAPGELMHAGDSEGVELLFSARGGGVAWAAAAGDGVQVFHNGRPGKRYAAVGPRALSPDGRRCAYGALEGGQWRMVVDGVEGPPFDAVRAPSFSGDGAHLAYQAMEGDRWYLIVDGARNAGTEQRYLFHAFDAAGSRLVLVESTGGETGRLVVSDLALRELATVDAAVAEVTAGAGGARFAAVRRAGAGWGVITFAAERAEVVQAGPAFDAVRDLAFSPDGAAVAYVGERAGQRFVVMGDREEPLGDGELVGPLVAGPGGGRLSALVSLAGGVALRQFFVGKPQDAVVYQAAEGLVLSPDGRSQAFAAWVGGRWVVVVDGHEGPPFDRVVTPVFRPDGKRVLYRAREGGRRFVVEADREGKTVRRHAEHEQVFPILFTADGRSSAYGVKDGDEVVWRVEPP